MKEIILDQRRLRLKPDDVLRYQPIAEDNEVVVLSGIRRCGKSTLLHEIRSIQSESDYFFNFDDERVLRFTVNDFQTLTELFIELFGTQNTYYFDEIQNIEGWERYIRRLRDYGSKVYIIGSNASMLSRELGTHITGRYFRKGLFPFSFKEFLRLKAVDYPETGLLSANERSLIKGQFNAYFESGGFPAYLKSGNKEYLKSLYESIMYRDVMVRNNLTNEKELLELVYYFPSNVGKLMSYNNMAKVVGVKNASTISKYVAFLQDSYLIFMINKYDVSLKKQMQNAKKGYLIDLGLLRTLAFHHTEDNGRLLENLVFLELKRRGKEIYFHNQKKECYFVMKEKTKILPVCWGLQSNRTSCRVCKTGVQLYTGTEMRLIALILTFVQQVNSKHYIHILNKSVLVSIYFICLISCCNEEEGYYYFPDGAINYYDNYDSIFFQDTLTEIQEMFVICDRDTGLSIFEWGGFCGYQDYYYSKSYKLAKDSCYSIPRFLVQVSPDTTVRIILIRADNHNVFYESDFSISQKNRIELCGFTYEGVITMESHSFISGQPILFSLRYGIIQYSRDTITFNLVNHEL